MPTSYNGGTNFDWPTKGDTNWDTTVDTALGTISSHNHTGGGAGTQIATAAIASNAVTDTKIRLANNAALRARNAAGSDDVDVFKVSTSDKVEILAALLYGATSTETLTASGAISTTTARTLLDGTSLAMTLAAGNTGQIKVVININATVATVTPGTTTYANTVSLGQGGAVLYSYNNAQWVVLALSPSAHVSDDTQALSAAGTWNGWSKHVRCTGTTYTITTPNGYSGQTVVVENAASGNVTFGGQVMATGTTYLYSYLNPGAAAWKRVALT
jgi:hypothetical protein